MFYGRGAQPDGSELFLGEDESEHPLLQQTLLSFLLRSVSLLLFEAGDAIPAGKYDVWAFRFYSR